MNSKFTTAFEKTAVVGALVRAGTWAGGRALKGVARLGSGNLRKPLSKMDYLGAGLTGVGAAADAGSHAERFQRAYDR